MVKIEEIDELELLLARLRVAIRRSEVMKSGKIVEFDPVARKFVEVEVKQEDRVKAEEELANALKEVSDKIKEIDWSRVG